MENEEIKQTVDEVEDQKQPEPALDDDVDPKPVDKAQKIIDKLHKRLDQKTKSERTLQEKLDQANSMIKQLRGEDEEQPDERDTKIKELQAELDRREAFDAANSVLKEADVDVDKDVLNMVVTTDNDQTDANIRSLIAYTDRIKEATKKAFLKGSTPRQNGKPAATMTRQEINQIKDPLARIKAIKDNPTLYGKE